MTSRQQDELASLRAIYDDCSDLQLAVKDDGPEVTVKVTVKSLRATFILPPEYPEASPVLQIAIGGADVSFADASIMRKLSSELEQLLETEAGNEVLFSAIELIRAKVEQQTGATTAEETSSSVSTPPSPPIAAPTSFVIHHSEPLVEKKSVFIAHVANVQTVAEVHEFRSFLLSDKKLSRATHNIFAYRVQVGTVVYSDCDDDGETAAGSRLAEMIRLMNLKSGVAVMVSRYFGGTLLGPDRFKYINNSARGLLEKFSS